MEHTKYTKISTIRKFPAIRYFHVPYSRKFSLVQNFMELLAAALEEI
jgi:CRISPR/Cas system-associated endonuclease Cas1